VDGRGLRGPRARPCLRGHHHRARPGPRRRSRGRPPGRAAHGLPGRGSGGPGHGPVGRGRADIRPRGRLDDSR
jgi:hypothetical protein